MILLSVLVMAAEASADGVFPLPVSLGISGISLGALLSFFVWQNKNISSGKWVPGVQVTDRLADKDRAYDDMVDVKDAQHEIDAELLREYRVTIVMMQESKTLLQDLLKKSIDANKLTDHFYATFMPKRGTNSPEGYDLTKEPRP